MGTLRRWLVRKAQKVSWGLLSPSLTPVVQELRRASLPERYKSITNPVVACGRRYFSQNDEDGILLEILRRTGIADPSVFLEIGVGDGTECNTIILLAKDWRGAWIGVEPLAFELPADARLAFEKRWITKDNVGRVARETVSRQGLDLAEVRVVSVDIDGNDGPIVRALLAAGLLPDVFIVEYNKLPPDIEFEMPYDGQHVWQKDDYHGVSLQRWASIFSDYKLICCNENGCNAFFVKSTHAGQFNDIAAKIEDLYRYGHGVPYPRSGQPTSPRMVRHLATRPPQCGEGRPEGTSIRPRPALPSSSAD